MYSTKIHNAKSRWKIDYKIYLYFLQFIFNLLLQCGVWLLMHNSEKTILSLTIQIKIFHMQMVYDGFCCYFFYLLSNYQGDLVVYVTMLCPP
jgi:hypothetical protein